MILAIGHESGVGKDQFCIFVIDHLRKQMKNLEVTRVGFADRLYDFCHSVYGWAGFQSRLHYMRFPHEKNEILPRLGKSPRDILIGLGNHVRLYDPDVWLNAACRGNKRGKLQIVTDLRKLNEFSMLEGFPRVKIVRPGYESSLDSDIDLRGAPWDYRIINDGNLNDFHAKAVTFCDILIPLIRGELT